MLLGISLSMCINSMPSWPYSLYTFVYEFNAVDMRKAL